MNTADTAPIDLTEQTIDTFARIVRNGGNVPDGYKFEYMSDREWRLKQPGEVNFYRGVNYRLTPIPQPIAPPRFSVSTDPIGVLDSQKPGWIAKFAGGPDACSHIAGMLNRGERHPNKYAWTPIAPEMVPLDLLDAPPGSVFSYAPEQGWFPAMCNQHGIVFNGSCIKWKELKDKGCHILRPGPGREWALCEKPIHNPA